MANNDGDANVAARLHDGFAYSVTLRGGTTIRFSDVDRLAIVRERWVKSVLAERAGGLQAIPEFLEFSGARSAAEDESGRTVLEPPDGHGAVLASEVVAIRYAGPAASEPSAEAFDQAVMGARALFQAQRAALEEMGQPAAGDGDAAMEKSLLGGT